MNDLRVQAMFKRSSYINLSVFIKNQDYYDLSKKTIKANGNIYHIFKPNNFRDIQNLNQEKASMDITLNEFKNLTSTYWNEKYEPLTVDMTKYIYIQVDNIWDQIQYLFRTALLFKLTKWVYILR